MATELFIRKLKRWTLTALQDFYVAYVSNIQVNTKYILFGIMLAIILMQQYKSLQKVWRLNYIISHHTHPTLIRSKDYGKLCTKKYPLINITKHFLLLLKQR